MTHNISFSIKLYQKPLYEHLFRNQKPLTQQITLNFCNILNYYATKCRKIFIRSINLNKDVINKICEIKMQFLDEGFIIEGVFGSYARDDFNQASDIDILYNLDKGFKDKYKGFKLIARLDAIQKKISSMLNIEADLVQRSSLNTISAKYILPEVHYV